jgi:hypothetical protein
MATTQEIAIAQAPLGPERFRQRYRHALRRRAGATAVPYGYTALTASAFGVLIETHGPPTSAAAALFLAGAVLGFTCTALLASTGGSGHADDAAPALTGLATGAAAAAAFGVAALLAHVIHGDVSFGAVALAATAVYLGVGALAGALIDRRGPEGARSD